MQNNDGDTSPWSTEDPRGKAAQALYREQNKPSRLAPVIVVDGHGVQIRVNHGHLLIDDGIGQHGRQRRIPRAQRSVRRIVVLATDGMITLDASRWCADLRIPLVQVERSGRILLLAGASGPDDARLRRAQAIAPSEVKHNIARQLLTQKLLGQASVARDQLGDPETAQAIDAQAADLPTVRGVRQFLEAEAVAANTYFAAWRGRVAVNFAARNRPRLPDHWHTFTGRSSTLDANRSPRRAADPINALLNYTYGLAEVECRLALVALGLDPGLGVLHTDKKNRDSLTFDLLEPLRPYVDELIITKLYGRIFSARDFYETRQGICRLMPTITHELATWLPALAREVAPLAEHVAHTFTDQINGRTTKATVLTRANSKSAYPRPARSRTRQPPQPKSRASCRDCGQPLDDQRAKLCPGCWPDRREALARSRALVGIAEIARRRADGDDPTQTPSARDKRSKSLVAQRAQQRAWDDDGQCVNGLSYESEIQPGLSALPLSVLRAATGLSLSACSRIRSGRLRPHQRHWQALATVVEPPTPYQPDLRPETDPPKPRT